jgi:hypothetical protein
MKSQLVVQPLDSIELSGLFNVAPSSLTYLSIGDYSNPFISQTVTINVGNLPITEGFKVTLQDTEFLYLNEKQ